MTAPLMPQPLVSNAGIGSPPFSRTYDAAVREGNILALWHFIDGTIGGHFHALYATEADARDAVAATLVMPPYAECAVTESTSGAEFRWDCSPGDTFFRIRIRPHTARDEDVRWRGRLRQFACHLRHRAKVQESPELLGVYGEAAIPQRMGLEVWAIHAEGTTRLGIAESTGRAVELEEEARATGALAVAGIPIDL